MIDDRHVYIGSILSAPYQKKSIFMDACLVIIAAADTKVKTWQGGKQDRRFNKILLKIR